MYIYFAESAAFACVFVRAVEFRMLFDVNFPVGCVLFVEVC